MARHPGRYQEGRLRTLQRHILRWRATEGPEREVFFPQEHRPGEAAQTDFTWATELRITIAGEAFVHMLCVVVLPFSNWQWPTVCLSESMAALRRGVQAALFRLGRKPKFHQTHHSTAATHAIVATPVSSDAIEGARKRPFNAEYVALMRHFGMTPRTTEVGEKEQNGDVEAGHHALKRRLEQALLLRGHRDFDSREAWERFAQDIADKANRGRHDRLGLELAAMGVVGVGRLPEFADYVTSLVERKVRAGEIRSAKGRERWRYTLEHLISGTTGESEKYVPGFGEMFIDKIHVTHVDEWRAGLAELVAVGAIRRTRATAGSRSFASS